MRKSFFFFHHLTPKIFRRIAICNRKHGKSTYKKRHTKIFHELKPLGTTGVAV